MAIKFEKVTAGSVLLDVHRERMGNTTMRQWGCWRVYVVSLDREKGLAVVRWNGNSPQTWDRRKIEKLFVKPPLGYRTQCARRGDEPAQGKLVVALRKCRFCKDTRPVDQWDKNNSDCLNCGRVFDAVHPDDWKGPGATYRCQFCGEHSPIKAWGPKNNKCPKCGKAYDAMLAQEGDD
jgi:hypothetical protein